jgi:hypothetical protein
MKQLNFYKLITLLLLLINLGLVAFVWLKPPGPPPLPVPHHEVERLLDLDEEQKLDYKELRTTHRSKMLALNDKMDQLLSVYFEGLTGMAAINRDSLMVQIQEVNAQRILITYEHFNNIKSLCTVQQAEHFPEVVKFLLDNILKNRKKMPPPRRKR